MKAFRMFLAVIFLLVSLNSTAFAFNDVNAHWANKDIAINGTSYSLQEGKATFNYYGDSEDVNIRFGL